MIKILCFIVDGTPHTLDVKAALDDNVALLKNLEKEQFDRLSVKPNNDEPNLDPPTAKEQAIAEKLQQSLLSLSSSVTPGDVCDQAGLRRAMGVATTI